MPLAVAEIKRLAGLELNALRQADILPTSMFENTRIQSAGTEIYDLNGEILFYRVPVARGRERVAFADVGANESLGGPLLAVSEGVDWDEKAILLQSEAAGKKARRGLKFDKLRFVAYSYPKIAVQFLSEDKEVLMLEWTTWAEVPPRAATDRKRLEPGNFERWSLLDELPATVKRANAKNLAKRMESWAAPVLKQIDPLIISKSKLTLAEFAIKLVDTAEIHYSKRASDHHPCYELRGQQTNVWCVGASAEMLLNFYRYDYTQVRLAQELGLGTLALPNGLPYSNVGLVVTVINNLTSNSLAATMHVNPAWTIFQSQIKANRPLISFIPGHSRTVVGYTRSLIALPGMSPFRGLLVYDPWPPNAGVITRWENFDTQTYQYAYSAVLKQV